MCNVSRVLIQGAEILQPRIIPQLNLMTEAQAAAEVEGTRQAVGPRAAALLPRHRVHHLQWHQVFHPHSVSFEIDANTRSNIMWLLQMKYRVTHHVRQNLLLTSKQEFRFGLAWAGLARPKRNFCFKVNGRFWTT